MSSAIIETLRQRKSLMSTSEVMAALGIKARCRFCQQVREGRLQAILLPGGYRFDLADVADYLEAREIGADRHRKAA